MPTPDDRPARASGKYRKGAVWFDEFARKGEIVTQIFFGDIFLAEVRNLHQARNIEAVLSGTPSWDACEWLKVEDGTPPPTPEEL